MQRFTFITNGEVSTVYDDTGHPIGYKVGRKDMKPIQLQSFDEAFMIPGNFVKVDAWGGIWTMKGGAK